MQHGIVMWLVHQHSSGPPGAAQHGVAVLPPKGLNTSVYLDLNRFSRETPWAHGFMHAYALWLGPVLLALVFLATYSLAWWHRSSRTGALLILGGIGTVVSLGFNLIVAHAARELRPYDTHPHVLVLVAKANDYSFPSDHSVVAGGLTLSLLLVLGSSSWRKRAAPAHVTTWTTPGGRVPVAVAVLAVVNVTLGLFLCFARVYVGAHYPGDVVAGYLLSSLVVVLFSLLRPLAYSVVDIVEPTALGFLLRRPPSGRAGGTSPSPPLASVGATRAEH